MTAILTTAISTQTALKEWAVAIEALIHAETILLLRKGGIHEQGFKLPQPQFWLYPTYEHQKPHLLKSPYANQVTPVESGWHPETVTIQAWAEVTDSLQISEAAAVAALLPFHVWTQEAMTERLKWKPRSPMTVLLLRVYRLTQPQSIPFQAEYGGCKSWIELVADLNSEAVPVLDETEYREQVAEIKRGVKQGGY